MSSLVSYRRTNRARAARYAGSLARRAGRYVVRRASRYLRKRISSVTTRAVSKLSGRKRASSGQSVQSTKRVRREAGQDQHGLQWYRGRMRTGRPKRGMALVQRLTKVNGEKLVYRLRCVKSFYGNGDITCDKFTDSANNYRSYPMFAILLNGKNCGGLATYPFRQLYAWSANAAGTGGDGRLGWRGRTTMNEAGSKPLSDYAVEFGEDDGRQDKMLWRYSNIKMNLWGAKYKPVRWTIEVCRVTDHRVSPFLVKAPGSAPSLGNTMNPEAQQNYEELIKHYYFNPISTINWHNTNHIKVLKRFDKVINPIETTDGDNDPKVFQLNWHTTWDRVCDYTDQNVSAAADPAPPTNYQPNEVNFEDAGERINELSSDSFTPKGTSAVFLLIRCSDFSSFERPSGFSNNIHGSFDFDIRTGYVKNS